MHQAPGLWPLKPPQVAGYRGLHLLPLLPPVPAAVAATIKQHGPSRESRCGCHFVGPTRRVRVLAVVRVSPY